MRERLNEKMESSIRVDTEICIGFSHGRIEQGKSLESKVERIKWIYFK
jgi:hypothetical protein